MYVFLTGSTGFIGSYLLKIFSDNGVKVKALVRKPVLDLLNNVEFVTGDLSHLTQYNPSSENLEIERVDVFRKSLHMSDVVVHAASRTFINVGTTSDILAEYRKINTEATLSFARLSAKLGVSRFVFISSVKANGEITNSGHPFKPDHQQKPSDPYGLSKFEAERGLLAISRETGMEVVIIRSPIVYGPGVKGNFSLMVDWVKKGVPLPFGLVDNQRSLVALDNLVDFIVFCSDRDKTPSATNEIFLISDLEDISLPNLLLKISKAYGVRLTLLPVPVFLMSLFAILIRKRDIANRLFGNLQVDSSKAYNLLGWKPTITMDEQLKKMAEFDKKESKSL